MNRMILIALSFLVTFYSFLNAQKIPSGITTGPEHGTLMVIGGSAGDKLLHQFYELAGGDSAKIVIIPTAYGEEYLQKDSTIIKIKLRFQKLGFKNFSILHTSDTAEANKPSFCQPIKEADAIYFLGGRQWRIADGFLNTLAHKEMFNLLNRGGIIGGSSAGATIQGSFLVRGDTKNNQIMMGDHEQGLSFISNIAIDQHSLARNRHFDMFDILKNKPELLGISIDENTAILVKGNEFEVIGESFVLVYDGSFWSREGSNLKKIPPKEQLFYFLRKGDKYNLKTRKVIE